MASWVKLTDHSNPGRGVWINLSQAQHIRPALLSARPDPEVWGTVITFPDDEPQYVRETPEQIFKAAYIIPGDPRTPTERIPENGR